MTDLLRRLSVLATDHEADDVIPDVALDAVAEIQVLRHIVRILSVDHDPSGRSWMKHSPADEAFHRALQDASGVR